MYVSKGFFDYYDLIDVETKIQEESSIIAIDNASVCREEILHRI